MAEKLATFYSSHSDVKMVCLGGSSARGIADEYSDLDIIIYWAELDEDWIRNGPLAIPRTDLLNPSPGIFIESYHIEGLKADFGHVKLDDWKEWLKPLHNNAQLEPELIDMAGGFLSSVVFYGKDEFQRISSSLAEYPDSLALHVVRMNMRFFVRGYLENQCFDRGDLAAYHDGMLAILKKLMNIIAALNRYYFYAGELRWIDYHLKRMPIRPADFTWETILGMLENPGHEAVSKLYLLQDEILSLVEKHFPDLSEEVKNRRNRINSMAVRKCSEKPSLKGI